MIEHIQTLISLSETGTMQKVALKLHVTQSTVSKRIAELERRLDKKLIEHSGRHVVLTSEGEKLVQGGRTLVQELMSLINEPSEETAKSLTISVAPSILIPWGAEALAKVEKNIKGLKLNITVLHSMLSLEALETGSAVRVSFFGEYI